MQALLSKARQQDVVALLPPCLLVFAVPLLLPGVTITTVGLLDNPGFPKYGALHIVGMILLAFSIVLIGAGIAVGCALGKRGSHRVKPVEEEVAAHTYNTHAASDKDGRKLGLQHSSNTRPGVQHVLPHRRPEAAPSDMTPAPHQGGAPPAVPLPVTALAVHDKSGLGQYSVNYCSFQNEVELGQCSADDCSDENEVKLTSCDLTPEDGMSRAPVLLLTSGISSGRCADPSTSPAGWQEAQEQLSESSDVAKSAVISLGSRWVENDDNGGHHKRGLPKALSMDAARVRADGARDLGAEHAEDKSRCSHAARDTCDLHPASPQDSSTSASVVDTPVQGPPHWRSSVHGLAITRLPVSSRRDEALTSVTATNSSLPAMADTHDSSEAKTSFGVDEVTSRERAAVDVTLSLRPGEEIAREEEVPQTSLSRFLSPSSAPGVGEESQTSLTEKNMSARRLWGTSCVLQCDETPADETEARRLSRALADDSTTLARVHAKPDDNDPSKAEEFSRIKTQRSRKQKDCDVSLVSFTQKKLFHSSSAATGPSELCDKYFSEQVELSNYSPKDQSLSIISLEYPSDLVEGRETDSNACVDTSPLSSAHLFRFHLVETLTQQTNHAQRPEQSAATSDSRETKTTKKKKRKNKQKKSRKGQVKTVDLKHVADS